MASSEEFIRYVAEQLRQIPEISYKKMFGEYMLYAGIKPILLICDDTVFVKILPPISEKFAELGYAPDKGHPYKGAKEHYVLDIDNEELSNDIARILEEIIPIPKPKVKKIKKTV